MAELDSGSSLRLLSPEQTHIRQSIPNGLKHLSTYCALNCQANMIEDSQLQTARGSPVGMASKKRRDRCAHRS